MARRRRSAIEKKRQLHHSATVEAAIAHGAGLAISDQVELARNMSAWCGGLLGIVAAAAIPAAVGDPATVYGLFEVLTAVPALILGRRAWMLQRSLRVLREANDPALTDGDDELAHLRELIQSLESKAAKKVGKGALAAAQQAFGERRRVLVRRSHVEALAADAESTIGIEALSADLANCDTDVAEIDDQIRGLIMALVDLVDSDDDSRTQALAEVQEATDRVRALAQAWDELHGSVQP